MSPKQLRPRLLAYIIVCCLLLALSSCKVENHVSTPAKWTIPTMPDREAWEEWVRNNPCGSLTITRPPFNVTGHIPAGGPVGSSVFLFIAPNVSRGGAFFAVDNCAPLMAVPIREEGQFYLGPLPEGDYVVVAPKYTVRGEATPPVIEEYVLSDYAVTAAMDGRDEQHALTVFSVRPIYEAINLT